MNVFNINKIKNFTAVDLICWVLVFIFFSFPISLALANLLIAIFLVLFLLKKKYFNIIWALKSNPFASTALALYVWILVGIFYSNANWAEITLHLGKYYKLLLIFIVASSMTVAIWRKRAWIAFSTAMLFTLASTYGNIWWQLPWSRTQNTGWGNDHTVIKDYISQGLMMAMFSLALLSQAIDKSNKIILRFIFAFTAGLALISITHLSNGKTGYLAAVCVILAFAVFSANGKYRPFIFLITIILGSLIYLSSTSLQARVNGAIQDARNHSITDFSSTGQRLYFANKTWALIKEKPILGWGTGSYHQQFCKVADNDAWCQAGKHHPHNQILFIWMEHGIIGALLLMALIFAPLIHVWNRTGPKAVLMAGFTGLFLVGSVTHGSLWLSTENHFFTLIGALIASAAWPAKETVHAKVQETI